MPDSIWSVKVVSRTGFVYDELEAATIQSITWELNGFGAAEFTIPTDNLKASSIKVTEREIQIWKRDRCIWWGVPLRISGNSRRSTVKCLGLLWYFSRRLFGPNTSNDLLNPSFELGLANWSFSSAAGQSISTSLFHRGSQALRMEPTANLDEYASQTHSFTHSGPTGYSIEKHLAGWFYLVRSNYPYGSPMSLKATVYNPGGSVYHTDQYDINLNAPTGVWTKAKCDVRYPTGVTSTATIMLSAGQPASVGDIVYWDSLALKTSMFVGADPPADVGTITANVLNYAHAKSSLNMIISAASTGVMEARQYLLEEHGNCWDAIEEFTKSELYDIEATWNASNPGSRTIQTYVPTKGSVKSRWPIMWGDPNVLDFDYSIDGAGISTSVRAISSSRDVTGEYAWAENTSDLGGLILESTVTLPKEASLKGLDRLAAATLAQRQKAIKVPTVTLKEDLAQDFLDNVFVGDTVLINIDHGLAQENSNHRLAMISLQEPETRGILEIGYV